MSAEELKTFREKSAKLSPEKQKQVETFVDFLLDQVKKSQNAGDSKKINKSLYNVVSLSHFNQPFEGFEPSKGLTEFP